MAKTPTKLIRKANELVESRYKFDIWETRVFAKMITLIDKDDEDFKQYRIHIKDIQKDFGLTKNKDAYTRLKEGARRLMSRIIKITYKSKEGKKVLETPVIIGLETTVNKTSYIDVSFHPNMKPFLLQLKSQYLMYDIRNILRISSVYSIRIYELLKQYERIGYRIFEVDELKEILGVTDKYPLYANFKQRLLKKAKKDLSKNTDIDFEFEEIKSGRAVEKIKFLIFPNNPRKKNTIIELNAAPVTIPTEIEQAFRVVGIQNVQVIQDLLNKCGEEYVMATLDKCEAYFRRKGDQVNNKAGYVIEALKAGFYKETILIEQKKVAKKAKKAQVDAAERQEKNDFLLVKQHFLDAYHKKIDQLRMLHLTPQLTTTILELNKGRFFYESVWQKYQLGEGSRVLDAWINDYLAQKYLQPLEHDLKLFIEQQYSMYAKYVS